MDMYYAYCAFNPAGVKGRDLEMCAAELTTD